MSRHRTDVNSRRGVNVKEKKSHEKNHPARSRLLIPWEFLDDAWTVLSASFVKTSLICRSEGAKEREPPFVRQAAIRQHCRGLYCCDWKVWAIVQQFILPPRERCGARETTPRGERGGRRSDRMTLRKRQKRAGTFNRRWSIGLIVDKY